MLQAEAIDKTFPTRSEPLVVLRGVSLKLEEGQSAAITGPSGSGKSTLLNILGTLEPPTSGRVTIDETDPYELDEKELAAFRNRRIGFIFQDHHLLAQCNVLENVLIPTLVSDAGADRVERARRLLDRVGLAGRVDHRPAELSGGERQRVAVARAMINGPGVLLADEPTGNLDRKTAEAVADLMIELHKEESTVLLVVTHSSMLAERFSKRYEMIDATLSPM